MGSKRKKYKIPPSNKPKNNVKTKQPLKDRKDQGKNLYIDVSFQALYYGVKTSNFINYCINSEEFVNKFVDVRRLIAKLSDKEFKKDLINNSGMRHCHLITEKESKRKIALSAIQKSLEQYDDNKNYSDYMDEIFGEEKIYQWVKLI